MQSIMDQDIDHILVSEEQLKIRVAELGAQISNCLLYTSPSPRDRG